jgi:hypothetical protein
VRRVATGLAVVVVALAGVVGLLAFFESRDQSTTAGDTAEQGPGRPDPSAGQPSLELGNVVLRYAQPGDRAALIALAGRLAGADTSTLRQTGQAVILVEDPAADPILAQAWKRSLRVTSAADPRLQDFVEAWLGRGKAG